MTIRPWQTRSALAVSLVAALLAPLCWPAALAQAPEESLASPAPASLQTEADALYAKRQFKEALSKYEKLLQDTDTCENRMTSAKSFSQEQLKAMTDLADCLCQAKQYSRARAIY